ncbi:MAG: VCBS repeat-containing protein [Nitrospirae bacterium]|nr:VCBS repeat-containing protein [Nitrospirota bacterium]
MRRLLMLAVLAAALLVPALSYSLTPQEEELLRKAGVSEEKITEMKNPAPEAARYEAVVPPPFDITDWNADGKKDIIAGTSSGELNVFMNTGTNEAPEFEDAEEVDGGDVDSGTISVPCIVDWNNDGAKDVLMGNRAGTVFAFINRGTNSAPRFSGGFELMDGDLDVGSYSAPAAVDWDADGNKDLVVGSFDGTLYTYINTGTDAEPQFKSEPLELHAELVTYSTFNYTTPFIVRNHDNGLFDIITGCGDGRVYRFRNAGTKGAPRFSSPQHVMVNDFIYQLEGNSNVIATDWDGDGIEDLLVSNRTTTQTEGTSSTDALSRPSDVSRRPSRVYLLKNVGTNKLPRYDRAVEILKDKYDINI